MLQCIYRSRPAALPAGEKVEVRDVVKCSSMEELLHDLAAKQVHRLSYRGVNSLDDYVSKNFNISLFSNEDQRKHAVRLVEIRNLIVHNRGIVSRRYKEEYADAKLAVGERLRMRSADALDELRFLIAWIADLDFRVCRKFDIPTQPRVPRPKIEDLPLLR